MLPDSPHPPPKKDRKLPLPVVLVMLYELAKVVFFGWVFWQCWQAQGSGIPPFGDVEAHNPIFEAPYFLVFALIAVLHLVLVPGLLALGRWARVCSAFPLICAVCWWLMVQKGGGPLALPVEPSVELAAITAELVAIAILYVSPESREAFSPAQ
jgi:hypothetical protein